jgi:hypothetical protein
MCVCIVSAPHRLRPPGIELLPGFLDHSTVRLTRYLVTRFQKDIEVASADLSSASPRILLRERRSSLLDGDASRLVAVAGVLQDAAYAMELLLRDLLASSFVSGSVALVLSVELVPDASFLESIVVLAVKFRSLSVSVCIFSSVLFLCPSASPHACC